MAHFNNMTSSKATPSPRSLIMNNPGENRWIADLPSELIHIILSYLSQLSQVSLVISCKNIYRRYKYILKAPAFQYPYSDGPDYGNCQTRLDLLTKFEKQPIGKLAMAV